MNCEEAQLHLGGEPAALSDALERHLSGCTACQTFRRETQRFERDLKRSFELPVPGRRSVSASISMIRSPVATPRGAGRSASRFTRRWAIAASVALATALGGLLWTFHPTESLAGDVVTHMEGEPDSWSGTRALPAASVAGILAASGWRLDPGSADVVYAQSCWFRGHWVPHLVVRTDHGPVTVMPLRAERMPAAESVHARGYDGELIPFDGGSLAVMGRDPGVVTPAVLDLLRSALHPVG